eukprot:NODE_1_length_95616_cov_0.657642.p74 type:complete len:123 gc:universal NODE_1_length_95616_cov_0.657642:56346-56714(+)
MTRGGGPLVWQTLDDLRYISAEVPNKQENCTLVFSQESKIYPFRFTYDVEPLKSGEFLIILKKEIPRHWMSYLEVKNENYTNIQLIPSLTDHWGNKSISADVDIRRTSDELVFAFKDHAFKT